MEAEGVEFRTGVEVGVDALDQVAARRLRRGRADRRRRVAARPRSAGPRAGRHPFRHGFPDAAEQARSPATTRRARRPSGTITAKGKHVVVIGGGDTGSDCIGTSIRQGAASITQLEIMPQPPEQREQGADLAGLAAEAAHLVLAGGRLRARLGRADQARASARTARSRRWNACASNGSRAPMAAWRCRRSPGSEFELKADLVLLAMGFLGPRKPGMVEQAGVALDPRGNVAANTTDYRTSVPQVFAAGDMRRGQSLVVWAIREGRQCARAVDEFLMGASDAAALAARRINARARGRSRRLGRGRATSPRRGAGPRGATPARRPRSSASS